MQLSFSLNYLLMNNQNTEKSAPEANNLNESLYRAMLRIRAFEEKVLAEFSSGNFRGTTHTYLGQEANAAGVLEEISENDVVVSNHRSHGHFLAYGGDKHALFPATGAPRTKCTASMPASRSPPEHHRENRTGQHRYR